MRPDPRKIRARREGHRTLLVSIVVGTIILLLLVFAYVPSIFPQNSAIIQRWRLTLIFHDSKTDTNSTLPSGIGVQGGLWYNHTLDHFGPPGYAPISTRDDSGTIYIETNHIAVFTFGDLFNIWGEPFNLTCVGTYCARPAELVVYDSANSHAYVPGDPVPNSNSTVPASGTALMDDQRIKFWDRGVKPGGIWGRGETIVLDVNGNSTYEPNDPVISGATPPQGTSLSVDPRLRFVDTYQNGVWDGAIPAPVMSDGGKNEGCVQRMYGLSDGKTWIIALNSPNLAAFYGCKS